MPTYRHTAGPRDGGSRLDAFLAALHPELTRSRIKSLIDEGRVRLAQGSVKAGRAVKAGDAVEMDVPAPRPAGIEPEAIPLTVLHEDDAIVIVDKPAGMAVHPGAGHASGTLVNALVHRVKDLAGIGGELRPGIVHRLDKDTSGCLVVAKTEAALAALQRAFKGREVAKTYLAIVHGVPSPSGTFSTLHGRHPKDRKRFTGKVKTGRAAVTHWRVVEAFDGAALVEVKLETGRTHQIRMHFAEAGHPLLGDALYGASRREARAKGTAVAKAAEAIGRQALHAWRLAFAHPVAGGRVAVEAPVPDDVDAALRILRATGSE